jgi:hypothetical protein
VPVVGAGQAGDAVHQQQRRVSGGIDGTAHGGDVGGHAGGGFVVHHAHRADAVFGVAAQPGFDQLGLHAAPPARGLRQHRVIAWVAQHLGLQAQAQRHLLPKAGEVAGLVHQHRVAGRQGVAQRRLPRAGARRRVDHHRMARLKNLLHAAQHTQPEHTELRPAVIDGGQAHGPQDAVGHRAGAGDLQEMSPAGVLVELKHRGSPFYHHVCMQNAIEHGR